VTTLTLTRRAARAHTPASASDQLATVDELPIGPLGKLRTAARLYHEQWRAEAQIAGGDCYALECLKALATRTTINAIVDNAAKLSANGPAAVTLYVIEALRGAGLPEWADAYASGKYGHLAI
jgi:hypothetical protein